MKNKIKVCLMIMIFSLAGCAKKVSAPNVPAGWHGLEENGLSSTSTDSDVDDASAEDRLGKMTDEYIGETTTALETAQAPIAAAPAPANPSSDKVPWHMEYFLTDLSVSARGLLGGLVMKGSPAITYIWRKQNPSPQAASPLETPLTEQAQTVDVIVTDDMPEAEMAKQLEPAIRAAVASGKVTDGEALRSNLLNSARDFQQLARGIGENPGLEWWVSRFRLDLAVEASGKVSPVTTIGGDLRFRFEWHRIMRKSSASAAPAAAPVKAGVDASLPGARLNEFVTVIAEDLAVLADDPKAKTPEGFKAYSFRVGVGMTLKHNIGIAKTSAGLIGQVYFSRDVAKPKVNPLPARAATPATIAVIENGADRRSSTHQAYAAANSIPTSTERSDDGKVQVVYHVERERIRKGLAKAAKIAKFFGRHSAQAHKGKWKVYELRTAFDLSLSGKLGLTELAGQATTEINFYNMEF